MGQEKSMSSFTFKTKFERLSSLVLVDILAALPMKQVMRLVRLDHETLRHTGSLKWVKDRMTDVSFGEIIRAHTYKDYVAATFCTNPIMKRLNGRVVISVPDRFLLRNREIMLHSASGKLYYTTVNIELVKRVPGRLHISLESAIDREATSFNVHYFKAALREHTNITYISEIIKRDESTAWFIWTFHNLVFQYMCYFDGNKHFMYYRPALLNGRHVIDVLRAVCGPADVSEAELTRIRREATENCKKFEQFWGYHDIRWEGVWSTTWHSGSVTAWEQRCRASFV